MDDTLLNFLDDPITLGTLDALLAKYKLQDKKPLVYGVLKEVFRGAISVEDFYDGVEETFSAASEDVLSLETDVYEDIIYPYEGKIRALFESKKRDFSELIKELVQKNSLTFTEPRLEDRFAHIIEQYVRGQYDEDRTLRALTKGIKPGGLEFSADAAKAIMDEIVGLAGHVRFFDRSTLSPDMSAPLPSFPQKISPPHEVVAFARVDTPQELVSDAAKKLVDALTPLEVKERESKKHNQNTDEVEEDILFGDEDMSVSAQNTRIKPSLPPEEKARRSVREQAQHVSYKKHRVPGVPASVPQTIKKITPVTRARDNALCDVIDEKELEELYAAEAMVKEQPGGHDDAHDALKNAFLEVVSQNKIPLHPDLCERFYHIIMARLKDIRNANDTRDVVMKPEDLGGLGLGAGQAQELLSLIERKKNALHEKWLAVQRSRKEEYLARRRDELFRTEQDIQDKTVPVSHTTSDMVKVALQEPKKKETAIVAQHLKTSKPFMQDVRTAPALLDPIGELQSYTLQDFRRLHSDPAQAVQRIEQKIDLLGESAYAKRYKGIEAWKGSEVMRVYREQLGQSLVANLPLKDVLEKRTSAGQPVLTLDEVNALTLLNARLRK